MSVRLDCIDKSGKTIADVNASLSCTNCGRGLFNLALDSGYRNE
jgi:hypothetical protein